jgi:PPOX class probable F420-dependent enzyme
MTTEATPLAEAMRGHQYLNLETFRRSGVGVRTPVWFAEHQGRLYIRTGGESGKVKRIRNQGRVRLAPSDAQGHPKGEWMEAQAELANAEQAELARRLFLKKYGLQYRGFEAMVKLRRGTWATIRLEPPAQIGGGT